MALNRTTEIHILAAARPANTIAVVQARMGSTRLPEKVLRDVAGEPLLARVAARVMRMEGIDAWLVATSTEAGDDAPSAFCGERGWDCFRGSEDDVLDRFRSAALSRAADHVLRVTADCPFLSWEEAGRAIARHLASGMPIPTT